MIYYGLKYPFGKGTNKYPDTSDDNDIILQSVLQIIQTGVGERIMNPNYGCRLIDFVFDNADSVLKENIKFELNRSISLFEPRAIISDIQVEINDNIVDITMTIDTKFKKNNVVNFQINRG
jgi:phage baseplate assembly protein W